MRARLLPYLLAIVGTLTIASHADARGGGTRVTSRIDLVTGRVDVVPPSAIPVAPAPAATPAAKRTIARVVAGAVHLIDPAGADRTIATGDTRDWLTWDVEVGGVVVFAVRSFTIGLANDNGHDVIRAFSQSGSLLWTRIETAWVPAAYDLDGALALAAPNRIDLVDPRTGAPRCSLTMTNPWSWPVGTLALEPKVFLYYTSRTIYAIDATSCGARWSAPSGDAGHVPLLHRGKLYDVTNTGAGKGGSLSVVERDPKTGASTRTFLAATYNEFFDRARARLVPSGDTLFVDAGFIVLD